MFLSIREINSPSVPNSVALEINENSIMLLFVSRFVSLLLFDSLCTVDDKDSNFTMLCSEMTMMLSDSCVANWDEDEASSFAFNASLKTAIPYKREVKNSPFGAGSRPQQSCEPVRTRREAQIQTFNLSLPYCCLALNRTALLTRDKKLWWFDDEGEARRSSTCRQVRFESFVSSSYSQFFLSF